MAITHTSILYDVNDFKVTPMTADTGGAPTYGTAVDVPGIQAVTFDPNLLMSELRGDAQIIAKRGSIDRFKMSAQYGRLSLDAIAVVMGGTTTDVVSPVATAWSIGANNSLPYFKAQFSTLQGDTPDTHITGYKCQLTGGTLIDLNTNAFNQPKLDWEALPCVSDPTLFVKVELLAAVTPLV